MSTTPHTSEVKALAAALYALLADFNDYDGRTFRMAPSALRDAGFDVQNPPGAEPAAARVRIEVRGGVADYTAEGDVDVELVDYDDGEG